MIDVSLIETGLKSAEDRYRAMSRAFTGAPRKVSRQAAEIILEMLKRNAPTGQQSPENPHVPLRHDLRYELEGVASRYVARFNGPFYLKWVIEGRGPVSAGILTGRSTKKFLHFWIGGKEIFTRRVGPARPNDFRIPAMAEAEPRLRELMHEAGVRTIRGEIEALNFWSEA